MSFTFGPPSQTKSFSFTSTNNPQQSSFFQPSQSPQQQQQPQSNVFQSTPIVSGPLTSGFPSSFGNLPPATSALFPQPDSRLSTASTSVFPSSFSATTAASQPSLFQTPTTTAPSVLSVPVGFPQQKLPATPENIVRSVREAWDPTSPYCQFKHYFYNLVHPSQVKKYSRGSNDDEKLWEHAVKNNPDPTCLVPSLAVGFGDLKKRTQEQEKYLRNMRYRLGEIKIALDLLSQRHEIDNRVRVQEVKRTHQAIAARVLSLMKKIHCMRSKGMAFNLDEDRLKGKLEALVFQLKKPGQYKSRVASLWRELSVVGGNSTDSASEKLIATDTERLYKVLSDQYQGIGHVIDVMKQDQHDLNMIDKLLKRESDEIFDKSYTTN